MVERSLAMVIGIMGILKSGGAYLPIDPAHPRDRIKYILEDSNMGILLTASEFQVKVKAGVEENSGQPRQLPLQLIKIEPGLVSTFESLPSTSTLTSTCRVSSTNLAYVLYTSGSLGRPKGVLVGHRPVINVLYALNGHYPFEETCIYLLKTSYEFDVSAAELFGWFPGGGALAILKKQGEKDPGQIIEAIAKLGVTHINFVPSMFRAFVDSLSQDNIVKISRLKYIFLAGEALSGELVNRFAKRNPGICLENIYGPTEAAVYASKYSLSEWQGRDPVPIGKPLANVKLYIFDSYGHLQGMGIPGELGIAGAGLARGYLNKPELTARKFPPVTNRFDRSDMSYMSYITYKVYKTGDLARWLADGNIEYLGRIDHQVKIRGFRIEPGEIERQLLTRDEIKEAIVVSREAPSKDLQYLYAYFVSAVRLSGSDLREHLGRRLPGYMVPSYFVQLTEIPLNSNGKVDRKMLPTPAVFQRQLSVAYAPSVTHTEKLIAGIWKEVLNMERIGIDDNFFDIGGNSLNVLQVNNKLNDVFDNKLTVIEMFRYTTIRSLSQFLNRHEVNPRLERKKWAETVKRSKTDIEQAYQKRSRKKIKALEKYR
jgi:polyketide synthase PksN